MKISDKINQIIAEEKDLPESEHQTYYSYEYFPPKTPAGKFIVIIFCLICCFDR